MWKLRHLFRNKIQQYHQNKLSSQFSAIAAPVDAYTYWPTNSIFYSFHLITDTELKATILKSKPTSCSLYLLPTSLFLEFLDHLLSRQRFVLIDPSDLKKLHPVSNLCFLSDIIFKVVVQQLLTYLTEHSLICPQSTYSPQHSTETAILKVTINSLLALDSGSVSLLTLGDLLATFDTIDHSILFNRLQQLSHVWHIYATALSWVFSYVINRTQSVIIADHILLVSWLFCGVPQHTV